MRRTLLLALGVGAAFVAGARAEEPRRGADAARGARVFAVVGSETITVGELEENIGARSAYARRRLAEGDALRKMADAQLESELFYQAAVERGYANDPEVQRLVEQTMVKVFVRRELEEGARPSDAQIAQYYESHPEEFRQPEMRRARHILVGSEAEAREVRTLITSGQSEFEAMAKTRSLDAETNIRGGDLLFFTATGEVAGRESRGRIDPTLTAAAYALDQPGELSPPLDLGDEQWSVLELTGIRPARVRTLERAAAEIRSKLWRQEADHATEQLITALRAELQPEVHPERLDAVVPHAPPER